MNISIIYIKLFLVITIISPCLGQTQVQNDTVDVITEYGYLNINSNFETLYIIVDKNFSEYYVLKEGDSLRLPAGERNIIIASEKAYDSRHTIIIPPDNTHIININFDTNISEIAYRYHSSYPRLMWESNVIIHTDNDSEILFQGETIGRGFAALDLPEGNYTFTTKHPDAGRSRTRVFLREDRLTVLDMYTKPSKSVNRLLSVIPGASQVYKNQPVRGALIVGGAALIGYFSYDYIRQYNDANDHYTATIELYRLANSEAEALYFGNLAEELYDEARSYAKTRDIFLVAGGLFYAFNIWDAWRKPKSGYRDSDRPDPYRRSRISAGYNPATDGFVIDFTLRF